jgi:hypothetical protein
MQQRIVGFSQDEEGHWRAELACGHLQHVRHEPPLISRPWVLTPNGRAGMIGMTLDCRKCDEPPPPVSEGRSS